MKWKKQSVSVSLLQMVKFLDCFLKGSGDAKDAFQDENYEREIDCTLEDKCLYLRRLKGNASVCSNNGIADSCRWQGR